MNLDGFVRGVKNIMNSVNRVLQTDISEGSVEMSARRLRSLRRNVNRMAVRYPQCQDLIPDIEEVLDIVESINRDQREIEGRGPALVRGAGRGRPRYDISRVQLELLLDMNFKNSDMASMLNVSTSVVKRRLREAGLSRRTSYSAMTDAELDGHIRRITVGNPMLGQRNVAGQLQAEGHRVQRQRVADSLLRVDPAAVAMRWSQTIQRRTYRVPTPNALWHIDGNHKLIRWGIVIHGGIDGFSRLIIFLKASMNNRPATVFDAFVEGTYKYGVPSRVRCDKGVENLDIATFMNGYRGHDRGSCITGRSVHNQRIERFWRDLYHGCTNVYKRLFERLQEEDVLHLDNDVEFWCLQYVFLPRLNRDLQRFAEGWNCHRVSTDGGKTPRQLYIQGIVENIGRGHTGVDELFFEPVGDDDAWEDDVVNLENEVRQDEVEPVIVPHVPCPLADDAYRIFRRQNNPLRDSEDPYGSDLYIQALQSCLALL